MKILYPLIILVLLLAIGFVQLTSPPMGNEALAKHTRQSDDGSILSTTEAIARLYFLLPVFTEPERREGLSLQERVAIEDEFISLLNRIPESAITDKMLELKLVNEAQLSRIHDRRGYINRLADVAMNGIITPGIVEAPRHGDVFFRPGINSFATRVFSSGATSVYAFFDSSAYDDDVVFVKWYAADTGRMSLFKQFSINTGDVNYIWIQDTEGLPSGNYRVEIYRVGQNFELLSSGGYRIE